MIRSLFGAWRPGISWLAPVLLLAPFLAVSCGGDRIGDAEEFYAKLADEIRKSNGGYMYDMLDSARRADLDTLIGMHMASLDSLPLQERVRWDSLKGKSKRDIYAKIIEGDQAVKDLFQGTYKILDVDTLVVLTVQPEGEQPNLMYLRPSNGSFKVTFPPKPPDVGSAPVQRPAPQQAPMPPGNGGGGSPQGDTNPQLR